MDEIEKQTKGKILFHAKSVEELLRDFGSSLKGISRNLADIRLKENGPNQLPEKAKESALVTFFKQFKSALIYILLGAAGISFLAGHAIDGYVILAVVVFNASIGYVQQHKAERAIDALKKLIVYSAKVFRDGEEIKVLSRDIVVGDVVILEEGDRVPADGRLVECKDLKVVESSLTGESFPVEKHFNILPEKTVLADRKNMVWMGTSVVGGAGKFLVTSIGKDTVLGEVAESIEGVKRPKTHFEQRTSQLAFFMAILAVVGAIATFLIGYFLRGLELFDIFLFSIASLVSGIPEGLPAVLIIVLAIGAWRMAQRNGALRHLPSAETLGVVTVIASDKTGTLTRSSMMVEKVALASTPEITVSGDGYKSEGSFYIEDKVITISDNIDFEKLANIAAVCNSGRVYKDNDRYEVIGDPTEAALLVMAEKTGLYKNKILETLQYHDEIPFNRDNKYRASLVGNERKEIYVAGAFEEVLDLCTHVLVDGTVKKLNKELKNRVLDQSLVMAGNAYRVLAMAYKKASVGKKTIIATDINKLVWVGAVGMMDPPRPEVKEAIVQARKAGIRIIMKTGDHQNTALAVAKQVGLIDEKRMFQNKVSLTESELESLSDSEFTQAVRDISVFARVTPKMKMRIVVELQKQGEIVAMTGDGVNDAPALKQADIGIAMGKTGTDVAREASEMVLVDDNFASIVSAVEQGRIIFHNVRQTSFYLVTTSIAENVTIIASLLLWLPLPLLPIHVLWLNLVTDGVSSVALAAEPGHGGVMHQPPRRSVEPILSWAVLPFGVMMVGLMAVVTIFIFNFYIVESLEKARTMAFTFMAVSQLFNAFNLRALKKSLFSIGVFSNMYLIGAFFASLAIQAALIHVPYFQSIFRFSPMDLSEWAMVIFLGSLALWLGEGYKYIHSKMVIE